MSSPAFTLPVFIASLYGLYHTPIFDSLMRDWWGHQAMMVHFLAVGLLFFWPIMGVGPAPHRPSHLMRVLELFVGMPFHASFGIAVMMTTGLLSDYFANLPAAWGIRALSDQHTAGAIAWGFSEIPTIAVLAAAVVQWRRADRREAERADRRADRDGGAELAAYTTYLEELAVNSRSPSGAPSSP